MRFNPTACQNPMRGKLNSVGINQFQSIIRGNPNSNDIDNSIPVTTMNPVSIFSILNIFFWWCKLHINSGDYT